MSAEATITRRSAWIDGDLIQQARTVGAHDGDSTSEVIERILRPALAGELKRVASEIGKRRRKPATHHELGEAGA